MKAVQKLPAGNFSAEVVDENASAALVLLAAVLEELKGIRAALEKRTGGIYLTPADREWVAAALPVIVGKFGSEGWMVRDLFEDGSPSLRIVLGERSPKSVGRLLMRAEGQAVDGLMFVRDGRVAGVGCWKVSGV